MQGCQSITHPGTNRGTQKANLRNTFMRLAVNGGKLAELAIIAVIER